MSRVACETAAALTDAGAVVQLCGGGGGDGSASPRADDGPPDSVLLRVPDGVSLTHLLFGAAAALRRDRSTKGSSNPKAAAEAEAATRKGAPRAAATTTVASSSKTAAVVIGVLAASKVAVAKERRARAPGPGRVGGVARASSWRRPAAAGGARVFASEAVGPEPVSPKVSCLGAVLPDRSASAAPPAGTSTTQKEEEEPGSGCWASLLHLRTAFLGLSCRDNNNDLLSAAIEPTPTPKAAATAPPEPHRIAAAVMSPPRPPVVSVAGLGDVKRLASRRWADETMAPPAGTTV